MANIDLPQVLVRLGYHVGQKTDWGNNGASNESYENLALTWPTGNAPLKSEEEFEETWAVIEAEQEALKYQGQRIGRISGYNEIPEQLDMLYWDVSSGVFGDEAKNSTWFQHCSGVKEQFPKP